MSFLNTSQVCTKFCNFCVHTCENLEWRSFWWAGSWNPWLKNAEIVYLCQLTGEQSLCLVNCQHFPRHLHDLCPMISFCVLSWSMTGVGETHWGDLKFADGLLYVAYNEKMMHLEKLLCHQTNKKLRTKTRNQRTMEENRKPQSQPKGEIERNKEWPQRDCSLRVEPPPGNRKK